MNKAHVTKLAKKHNVILREGEHCTPETLWAFANALEDSVYQRIKGRVASRLEMVQKDPGITQAHAYLQGREERVFALTKAAAVACCKEQDLRTRRAIEDLAFVEVVK